MTNFCAVDVTVNELSNAFGNDIEKENFLYSVTETDDPSTSVQMEISYNTETTEDSADNEDKKIDIKKGTISCEKNRKSSVYNKRGRKLGYRSENTKDDGAVCEVCGAKAGKHSYYGGYVCQSCRAFFRRCVQTQAYHSLECTGGTDSKSPLHLSCDINKSSRKNCRACRWERCIKAGMKISYVQFDTKINGSHFSFSENLTQILHELSKLSESLLDNMCLTLPLESTDIKKVDTLSLGHSLQIMSVVPSLKMFNKKYQTCLISESSHFVAVYRKVMYMHRLGEDIYKLLYPPGWCIIPTMEKQHHQLCSKVKETFHLDGVGRLLTQLIVMFQTEPSAGKMEDVEKMQICWVTTSLIYCRKYFERSGLCRSELGKMIMTIEYLRQLYQMDQLYVII